MLSSSSSLFKTWNCLCCGRPIPALGVALADLLNVSLDSTGVSFNMIDLLLLLIWIKVRDSGLL